jgi:glucan 1,3-beta-glucosidase
MFEISSAKMPFFYLAISLLSAIGSVTAAKVSISQVSSAVQLATSSFAPAVTYAGPTGSASSILAKSPTNKVSPQGAAATAGAAPYWLESITHQGISAFNSNPASYQVFRNVKSFGAKGKNLAVNL